MKVPGTYENIPLCITRFWCMCSKALQSWTKYFQIVRSDISRLCFLKCLIILAKSPASASSRTIFNSLSSINEAKYLITLGWSNCYKINEKKTLTNVKHHTILYRTKIGSIVWAKKNYTHVIGHALSRPIVLSNIWQDFFLFLEQDTQRPPQRILQQRTKRFCNTC